MSVTEPGPKNPTGERSESSLFIPADKTHQSQGAPVDGGNGVLGGSWPPSPLPGNPKSLLGTKMETRETRLLQEAPQQRTSPYGRAHHDSDWLPQQSPPDHAVLETRVRGPGCPLPAAASSSVSSPVMGRTASEACDLHLGGLCTTRKITPMYSQGHATAPCPQRAPLVPGSDWPHQGITLIRYSVSSCYRQIHPEYHSTARDKSHLHAVMQVLCTCRAAVQEKLSRNPGRTGFPQV